MRWYDRRYRAKAYVIVAWYDLWVGIFIDLPKQQLYLFPVPCLGVRVAWVRTR